MCYFCIGVLSGVVSFALFLKLFMRSGTLHIYHAAGEKPELLFEMSVSMTRLIKKRFVLLKIEDQSIKH